MTNGEKHPHQCRCGYSCGSLDALIVHHKQEHGGEKRPERIPIILHLIEVAWEEHPELRLGQLLCIFAPPGQDLFYVEDSYWEASGLAQATREGSRNNSRGTP